MKKYFILFFILSLTQLSAQELNCKVDITTSQISGTDKQIFTQMKNQLMEFMNNRKWTSETFKNEEKIECNIAINITERLAIDEFNATFNIISKRPVHGASYLTNLFVFLDQNIHFKYAEGQQLDYSENAYTSNLTSILAFYAYYIIGLDYDSFSLKGGTPYFQKALTIATYAQSAGESGWKLNEDRNRYWMINNMLDAPFIPLRECTYYYHRKGLDVMSQNITAGRSEILKSIELLQKVHNVKPLSFNVQLFFTAKNEEIINIFSNATSEEKTNLMSVLSLLDPSNNNKYQKIMQRK